MRSLPSRWTPAKSPAGTSDLTGSLQKADGPRDLTPSHDAVKGNKVSGDLVVPIQIVDNAVGVIGDAKVEGTSHEQNYSHNQDIATSGKDSGIAGNVVALDWALPVQLAGNGVGLAGGSGAVHGGSAHQSASETGNIDTTGKGSGLSGNVVAGQFATPVQVTGNAISYLLGNAYSSYAADTSATSGGSMLTNGKGGAGTGNVVGAPIALPVKFNGNAGGVWGSDADTASNSSADA
ncbi:MAG: PE-PGRS family protein, partial [Acidimicrobiales bacterium]